MMLIMVLGELPLAGISYAVDSKATLFTAAAALLFYYLWQKRRRFPEPHLSFSDINALEGRSGRARWAKAPQRLIEISLCSFALAFTDPHLYLDIQHDKDKSQPSNRTHLPVEGIGIYLVLDQSGSMKEEVDTAGRRKISKVDLLKQVTKEFIAGDANLKLPGRPSDMIGLIAFARGAHVLSPLTLDHAAVLQELDRFAPVGSTDDDGTSIGYAIFKAANLIAATRHYAQDLIAKGKPAYTIDQNIMILITDGLQDPNPLDKGKRLRNMDVPDAAAYAKEQGIRLYIVNVEPKLATEEFAPYRHIMQRAAESTGGKFFMVDNSSNLNEIYATIDQLEKSILPIDASVHRNKDERPDIYQRISLYPYLIALGLLALFVSLMLECTYLKRIP